MNSKLSCEIGFNYINKYKEQLCGDHLEMVSKDKTKIVVLADGLGSGVKANILSTLTSKIISTMMINDLPIEECVKTIASTLPVCSQRNVAYSTFTILKIINNEIAELYQYDNPLAIILRDGKVYNYPKEELVIENKKIIKSNILLQCNDVFILFSDGALNASPGGSLDMSWNHQAISEFMETMYYPEYSAKSISTILLDKIKSLYDNHPGDDTTVCVTKIRQRKYVNLMIGPSKDKSDDEKMVMDFLNHEGVHIICGGSSAQVVSRFLNKEIKTDITSNDPDIPPISFLEGIELVTEGIITLNKVLEYAKSHVSDDQNYGSWSYKKDGASRLARYLFEEATDLNFFIGDAINPAHQISNLKIDFQIKKHIINEIIDCLKKLGKNVSVKHY